MHEQWWAHTLENSDIPVTMSMKNRDSSFFTSTHCQEIRKYEEGPLITMLQFWLAWSCVCFLQSLKTTVRYCVMYRSEPHVQKRMTHPHPLTLVRFPPLWVHDSIWATRMGKVNTDLYGWGLDLCFSVQCYDDQWISVLTSTHCKNNWTQSVENE